MSMKEAEDPYFRRKEAHEAQRLLPYRSLQDKITVLHQEFDARVNAEVAVQVQDPLFEIDCGYVSLS
jgi:hypothetical protein